MADSSCNIIRIEALCSSRQYVNFHVKLSHGCITAKLLKTK
jgi:hypothetical protein